MKNRIIPFIAFALLSLVSCGGGSVESPASSEKSVTSENKDNIQILDPIGGKSIDLLYAPARAYLNSKNPASTLASLSSNPGDNTVPLTLRWKVTTSAVERYTLQIATDEAFEHIERSYSDLRKSVGTMPVYNLIPGTYYYRIKSSSMVSPVDSFVLEGPVRTINTNNTIKNMRDCGGWKIDDTHRVRYGCLYRSAAWSSADNTTESRFKELGMKTELDIRYSSGSSDYSKSEHPISGVDYVNLGMGQYDSIIPQSKKYYATSHANFKKTFELLAKKESYPLTFHCTAGADRTGTLAYLVNGLLGVSYEDLCKDFELTSIYNSKRWRSNIVDGEFDSSGVMQDDANNYVGFGALHQAMMENYKTSDNSLSGAINNYLKTVCGISQTTLNQVKANLTESI